MISEPACLQGDRASGHQAIRVQLETAAPPVLERGSRAGVCWRLSVPCFLLGRWPGPGKEVASKHTFPTSTLNGKDVRRTLWSYHEETL